MIHELYTDAVLTRDLPAHGLCAGDVVKAVNRHSAPEQEDDYSIEVFNTIGETITVTSIEASALGPLLANEVFSVRKLT